MQELFSLLSAALEKRRTLFADTGTNTFRLFHGFTEGCPSLCADRYADTLVIHHSSGEPLYDVERIADFYLEACPQLRSVLLKDRFSTERELKNGKLIRGTSAATDVMEHGVHYAVSLTVNKDCGFYLDSANLRRWILGHAAGKRVLNTFSYTGSYGVAAFAGGAASVTQTDMNRNYLKPRKEIRQELIYGDFFRVMGAMKKQGRLFDLILLDPPFFSATGGGRVDQVRSFISLLNKVRPLAAHEGNIVLVNNALFFSGKEMMSELKGICGEYLRLAETIPVPESFFGGTFDKAVFPSDPAPFNFPTKIVVLETFRKDQRRE